MLRYITIILLILALPFSGHANPFSNSDDVSAADQACKYTEVYSATRKTYLILNLVDRLALKKEDLKFEAQSFVETLAQKVVQDCSSDQDLKISKIEFEGNALTFEYGSGDHSIEWLSDGDANYVVYKKLYGSYKDEPLMVTKYNGLDAKEFIRITGRYGSENANTRYTFFFSGLDHKILNKIELKVTNLKDPRSLKSIYGPDYKSAVVGESALIKVGVVGTGLDYNHPGVAKHLAYRLEMEADLQVLEKLDTKLRESPFINQKTYEASMKQFNDLQPKVGFPIWMDQALKTKSPYDAVIVDKKRSLGPNKEHETRVTSRLLRTGGAVEVHFVRRSMGSIDDLNVEDVIGRFAEQGVRLVNLSFGSSCGRLPKEEKMWDEAFERYPEIVFVVSAGNSGFSTSTKPFCPAAFSKVYKNVISVTALSSEGQLAVYYGTPVNFGEDIDLAVKSDNLEVLIPFRKTLRWENNANGATSLAAAEVSRILTEVVLEGLEWNAQTVKELLVKTSVYKPLLEGVNKTSSEVDEWAFREALKRASKHYK